MQNFGVTNKEHYGMLWYFLERSINMVHDYIMCKVHDVYSVSADHLLKFSLGPQDGGCISPQPYQCLNLILLFLVVLET